MCKFIMKSRGQGRGRAEDVRRGFGTGVEVWEWSLGITRELRPKGGDQTRARRLPRPTYKLCRLAIVQKLVVVREAPLRFGAPNEGPTTADGEEVVLVNQGGGRDHPWPQRDKVEHGGAATEPERRRGPADRAANNSHIGDHEKDRTCGVG